MRFSMMLLISLAVASMLIGVDSKKIFTKCELAKILEQTYAIKRDDVKKYVCIAQYESSFNTAALGPPNSNGSRDYGLFQINNKYWCQGSIKSSNYCKISCSSLLTDDIKNSVNCAKIIASKQGFSAWVAYNSKCASMNLDTYMKTCWG